MDAEVCIPLVIRRGSSALSTSAQSLLRDSIHATSSNFSALWRTMLPLRSTMHALRGLEKLAASHSASRPPPLLGNHRRGFAHEVRNPLTSIKTFIQLRRRDGTILSSWTPSAWWWARYLLRIERLIEEILDYAAYMKPNFSLESINEIVASSLHFIEVKANILGVSIEKQLAEQLPPIMVDRSRSNSAHESRSECH